MKKTIVSITPLVVEADSRTFKMAVSFARFGYRSIVVEGGISALSPQELPFKLISLGISFIGKGNTTVNTKSLAGSHQSLRLLADRYATTSIGAFLFGVWRLRKMVKFFLRPIRRMPKADLYYIHGFEFFPLAWMLSKIYRAAIFYDAHDFYSEITSFEDMPPFDKRWIVPFKRRCEKRCFRLADTAVTVCDSLANQFEGEFSRRPHVLRNVHDNRLDRPIKVGIRDTLGLPPETFLTLTIGTAKEGQAIDSTIAAAKQLPEDVHFAFLGKGYEMHLEKVSAAGLKNRFHFLRPVLPFEVVPFSASANVALILYYPRSLNYRFALPNGFFQGIAAGLPTLYPDLPEIRRLAERYNLGLLIDTRNPDSISNAILRLLNMPSIRKDLAAGAIKAGLDLSWEREEEKLQSLVRSKVNISANPN